MSCNVTSPRAPLIARRHSRHPRIGPRRELKMALESFWSGKSDEKALLETAAGLRAANWARQKALGITVIPSNDFSLYDQVLDTSVMVGAIPALWLEGRRRLARDLFRHGARRAGTQRRHERAHGTARRRRAGARDDQVVRHQLPLHGAGASRRIRRSRSPRPRPVEEFQEAKALGIRPARCCSAR